MEHLFFLTRYETALRNLCRVRRQLLDTIPRHTNSAIGISFHLSLWHRMEPLQCSSQPTLSLLATLPTTLSLDPVFCSYYVESLQVRSGQNMRDCSQRHF